ncbi:MAG TPA: hypothetical protein VKT32_17375, partial [Chthonomonadaceae bacterium]|nr:hypothetical protein [Chthonomonadaceae bacterium]
MPFPSSLFVPVRLVLTGLPALLAAGIAAAQQTPYLHAPSVTTYARHDPAGLTILSSGRYLNPVGIRVPLARWPHGLVLSPDGAVAFVASEGVGQFITEWDSPHPSVAAFSPVPGAIEGVNGGAAAFSPDGRTLYWSSGDRDGVYLVDVAARQVTASISLDTPVNGRAFADSFVMDLRLSPDGRYLYCADVTNFRVAIIDLKQQKMVGSVDVGRYPYALAVAGKMVYVANIGMFAYSPIPAPSVAGFDARGLSFPPFGFPS